ncbi:MAG: L,D-transpeptidase family protein [Candidatus Eisenbacteria bacterium]|nr:L,D-transpeptidase family protein [Candidatus Eisenbacteria bacterium]
MSESHDPAEHARTLVTAALGRAQAPVRELPPRLVIVDAGAQRVLFLRDGKVAGSWPASTAANGIGGQSGSYKTPPGWHRIHRRIGAGAASGTVFVSREATGEIWRGEPREDDLILTRVLTLEGLEDGVNRGTGCDSLERYIYLHGTNHEHTLGTPASHGCVRLSNAGIAELFDLVAEGDPVVIIAPGPGEAPDPRSTARFHYAGVGGSGMSALAQFQAMLGGRVSGSDRGFDRGERPQARAQLERLGIAIVPQDGRGAGGDCAALVVSTAVESSVPDVAEAQRRALPIVHRSEMLASWVADLRSIAVSGTSGKSTVVAMIFEILRAAGRDPSVITGGELVALQREGLWGNAWAGAGELLVVEADESDGSLVRYRPAIGVALNLTRDHRPESEVAAMFATLRARTRETFVCGEGEALGSLRDGALVFGTGARAAVRGQALELDAEGSTFEVEGVRFRLLVPGAHNVENALAAIACCRAVGVEPGAMAAPLASFAGVSRRFQSLGTARGVEVVDDFAHNPAKIAAALATAQRRSRRVLSVYQPHGYGPTRFLREDLVETLATHLRPDDLAFWLEVYYAGGTATRDFSSADVTAQIAARGRGAEFAPSREWLAARLVEVARPGDLVLVMGARDPSLTEFAHDVLARLGGTVESAVSHA